MKAWVVLIMSLFVVEVSEGADISTTLSAESAQKAVVHPGPQPFVTIRSLPVKPPKAKYAALSRHGLQRDRLRRHLWVLQIGAAQKQLAELEWQLGLTNNIAERRTLQERIGERRGKLIEIIKGAGNRKRRSTGNSK